MADDAELLRRYADEGSEEAFTELVRRHIDLVYAAALRQAHGNRELARDAAQVVFADLACKARRLSRHEVLVGWLHTATRFATVKAVRTESRRKGREHMAHEMNELEREATAAADWERLRPEIDEALGALKARERAAILLRFFEKLTLAEVAQRLALTEPAARSCVDRTLEKMRLLLERRGVTSTTAALGVALANQATAAAPVGLAAGVTSAALTGAAAGAGGASAWMIFIGMNKLQIGIASAVIVAGAAGLAERNSTAAGLGRELNIAREQNRALAALPEENTRLRQALQASIGAQTQSEELARLQVEAAELRTKLHAAGPAAAAGKATAVRIPKSEEGYAGPVLEEAQVDIKPKLKQRIAPVYPAELRTSGAGGRVTIDLIVDPEGRVRNASVVSATNPSLGEAVLGALKEWRYAPAEKEGQAVAMHMQMTTNFSNATRVPAGPSDGSPSKQPVVSQRAPWF